MPTFTFPVHTESYYYFVMNFWLLVFLHMFLSPELHCLDLPLIYIHHFHCHKPSTANTSSKYCFRYNLCTFEAVEEADNDSQNVQCNELLGEVYNFWWQAACPIFVFFFKELSSSLLLTKT